MKKIVSLVVTLIVFALSGCTTMSTGAGNWQIYQSPLNARDQFLVNTVTGDVYQLYTNEEGRNWWGLMEKGIPAEKSE